MLGVTKTKFLMPDIPEGDVWQSQSGNKVKTAKQNRAVVSPITKIKFLVILFVLTPNTPCASHLTPLEEV